MELIGRTVKKEFPGAGIVTGSVISFDPVYGFFEISYQDGDCEELDFDEVVGVLDGNVDLSIGEKIRQGIGGKGCGRLKRKRRKEAIRDVGSGNFSDFLLSDGKFKEPQFGNFETLGMKSVVSGNLSKNCFSGIGGGNGNGFDLNVDISMGDEDGEGEGEGERACFDLNRPVEETRKIEHSFDINLGVEEEIEDVQQKGLEAEDEGEFKKVVEESQLNDNDGLMGKGHLVTVGETREDYNGLSESVIGDDSLRVVEDTKLKAKSGLCETSEDMDLGGDHRRVVLKDTGAYFHLKDSSVEVVLALKSLAKGASSQKKRGRPFKKTKLTTQADEHVQSRDRGHGGDCIGFASNEKAGNTDVVIAGSHEDKTCLEPLVKEQSSRRKRGRPSNEKPGGTGVDIAEKLENKTCLEPLDKEQSSRKRRGRRLNKKGGSTDVIIKKNHEDKPYLEPLDKEQSSRKGRGRPSKRSSMLIAQMDEHIQGEDRDLGENCRGDASNCASAFFDRNAGGSDVVITEDHENKKKLGSPDKEQFTCKKRGRPPKKRKSTAQTVLSTMKVDCSDMSSTPNLEERDSLETPDKEARSRRKRGRTSEDLNSTTQTRLRRSTRRSSSTSLNHISSLDESLASSVASLSHEVVLDGNVEQVKEQSAPPPKIELPPSSKHLNIDEISIIDLFSVYSFLRSFSTILYLSPFSLEALLEALRDNCPNSLIDSIHISILHTLKLHMEYLSEEGSQPATNCLRSLNWALLDMVTWPIYLAEYLLICGSAIKPGFELGHLKVFMDDYYKQSPALKIDILRCLCDDVIEAESVRLELNRRTQASELDMDVDRNANAEMKRKKKDQMDDGVGSCLTEDVVDETADGNSDDCCLCKMDGNLICCDGCPAAYHTRCVGIAKDTLPEGDWFCPECVINRYDIRMASSKSLRGAQLLGIDPHGRLYYGTCGYLLVLDSCDPDCSYNFYDSNDLNFVIEVLRSSESIYGSIIDAICMHWGILGEKGYLNSQVDMTCTVLDVNSQIFATTMSSVAVQLPEMSEIRSSSNQYETSVRNEDFDLQGYKVSESVTKSDSGLVSQSIKKRNSVTKSEALLNISEVANDSQTWQVTGEDCSIGPLKTLSKSDIPGETHSTAAQFSLQHTVPCPILEKNVEGALSFSGSVVKNSGSEALCKAHSERDCYVNCYTSGQTSASVVRELVSKSPDNAKEDTKIWTPEEIISVQLRAISKKSSIFCWSNIEGLHQNVKQDGCGWCFYCRYPTENECCLFNLKCKKPVPDGTKHDLVGLHSNKRRQSHIFAVICHILFVEERLCGLLSGPWKNANYSKIWRKNVLRASDVASVKHFLLTLESNLRHLALLPEWLKHVDSEATVGSASHVMTTPVQISSSKNVSGKKRAKWAKQATPEPSVPPTASSKLSTFWWRGGRLSRQLFNYKILPHSLASKGGRQAGCKKLYGILYPDGSEYAKRSKNIAWRASVETSTSVAHLAYLVREFESNIRWDDLETNQAFSHLSKESQKAMKLFKKVTIRRKSTEGTNIKYLLDFGKRRAIPRTVIRNGVMVEVSASERKKYWLEESLVPLHILKVYEEKKLALKSSKMKPEQLDEGTTVLKKTPRKNGLLYLLEKGQKSEFYKCGHCNKDVLIRDAVICQDCEGFFHKRHVRNFEHSSAAKSTYQCQRCRSKIPATKTVKAKPNDILVTRSVRAKPSKMFVSEIVKEKQKKRKIRAQKSKKDPTDERRKSLPRKVKYMSMRSKKLGGAKKCKQVKSRNQQSKKSKREICWYKERRTQVFHTYWLNGIRLTRNSEDECAVQFRESKLFLPSEHPSANFMLPKCCLCCEASYNSTSIYVNCENCQEWFHGEAFGITAENSSLILGFRCHNCRKKKPPLCPYLQDTPANEVELSVSA